MVNQNEDKRYPNHYVEPPAMVTEIFEETFAEMRRQGKFDEEAFEAAEAAEAEPMNIFETIARVTRRIEPFHSTYLGDALRESLAGDSRLFAGIWTLATGGDPDWPVPRDAEVRTEDVLGKKRIDVVIHDVSGKRVLGIEVKTRDASAEQGQLHNYLQRLGKKYPNESIRLVYLTPFNQERAGKAAAKLRTIAVFSQFAAQHPQSRHLSWLDIAELDWHGGEVWQQHRAYVHQHISPLTKLEVPPRGGREFGSFFREDENVVAEFWEALVEAGAHAIDDIVELTSDVDAQGFIDAFRILIESPSLDAGANKADDYQQTERARFRDSEYGEVHAGLFRLAEEYSHVWVSGKRDFGLRVAHPRHRSTGVSLARSIATGRFQIGQSR